MTSPLIFPALAGQGWSVRKKPTFATTVTSYVSAREVRIPNYVNPIWKFELTFDALDGTAGGQYGGLGAQSLQSLMGLFLQCQGQYGQFLYYDPTDYSVSAQAFGVGDGTTRSFQLVRSLGGFLEPVTQPFAPAAPALFQVQGSAVAYAPNNLFQRSNDLTAAASWFRNLVTVAGGAADPFGGTAAFTLTATGANGMLFTGPFGVSPAQGVMISAWVRRRTGSGYVCLFGPDGGWHSVPVTSTWQRLSISAAGGANGGGFVLGVSGDAIDIYGAQSEVTLSSAPGPYFQTLATRYYGGPWITVAGVQVDPSAYTIANGVVTFSAAPASGAALAWTGYFAFLCRFDADDLDFEQFMANLWRAQSVKFKSLRAQ